MELQRVLGDVQLGRDLAQGEPAREQVQDVTLAVGQALDEPRRRGPASQVGRHGAPQPIYPCGGHPPGGQLDELQHGLPVGGDSLEHALLGREVDSGRHRLGRRLAVDIRDRAGQQELAHDPVPGTTRFCSVHGLDGVLLPPGSEMDSRLTDRPPERVLGSMCPVLGGVEVVLTEGEQHPGPRQPPATVGSVELSPGELLDLVEQRLRCSEVAVAEPHLDQLEHREHPDVRSSGTRIGRPAPQGPARPGRGHRARALRSLRRGRARRGECPSRRALPCAAHQQRPAGSRSVARTVRDPPHAPLRSRAAGRCHG